VWRLDAGGRPDPAVLVRGAHLAPYAHDFRLVRRLIEAVPAEQLDGVGALLLGEALYELGVFDAVYAEAAGLAKADRLAGPRRLALSGLALAHATIGDADAAAEALAERATVPEFGFLGAEQQLADAWTAVAWKRPAEAADLFRAAAAQAASTGHRTAGSWLWHDLMRTSGQEASGRLRELADACDSPLGLRPRQACRCHPGS
jgi:hypothetical protein